jgi:hypothetical protein
VAMIGRAPLPWSARSRLAALLLTRLCCSALTITSQEFVMPQLFGGPERSIFSSTFVSLRFSAAQQQSANGGQQEQRQRR